MIPQVLTKAAVENEDKVLVTPETLLADEKPVEPPKKRSITAEEGNKIIEVAATFKAPYKSDGKNEEGADCNGAVSYIYRKAGFSLSVDPYGTAARDFHKLPELEEVMAKKMTDPKPSGGSYFLDGAQQGDILQWSYHVAIYDPACPGKMWSTSGTAEDPGRPFGPSKLWWYKGTPRVLRYQVLQQRIASG
jgi:hypothetical protein